VNFLEMPFLFNGTIASSIVCTFDQQIWSFASMKHSFIRLQYIGEIFVLITHFVECFQYLKKYGAKRLVVNNFFSSFE